MLPLLRAALLAAFTHKINQRFIRQRYRFLPACQPVISTLKPGEVDPQRSIRAAQTEFRKAVDIGDDNRLVGAKLLQNRAQDVKPPGRFSGPADGSEVDTMLQGIGFHHCPITFPHCCYAPSINIVRGRAIVALPLCFIPRPSGRTGPVSAPLRPGSWPFPICSRRSRRRPSSPFSCSPSCQHERPAIRFWR